ncbi:MAG TPA: hypothetical protein VGG27_15345 [Magnetospirillaceae bacterium]
MQSGWITGELSQDAAASLFGFGQPAGLEGLHRVLEQRRRGRLGVGRATRPLIAAHIGLVAG